MFSKVPLIFLFIFLFAGVHCNEDNTTETASQEESSHDETSHDEPDEDQPDEEDTGDVDSHHDNNDTEEEPMDHDDDTKVEEHYHDDDNNEAEGTYLTGMMAEYYRKFEGLSADVRKKEFAGIVRSMDSNKDQYITLEEIHKWALKMIEEDASKIDFVKLDIMGIDTNNDGKISLEEYEADQKKLMGETKNNAYDAVGQQLKKERVRFNYVDQDKDGFITKKELPRLVLPESFADMNEMAVEHFILSYDTDGDGQVSKKEFEVGTRFDPNIDEWAHHFKLHDKNKDEVLSKEEIREHALDSIAAPHIVRELKTILRLSDTDKDGKVSYEELEANHIYFTDSKKTLPQEEIEKTVKDEL